MAMRETIRSGRRENFYTTDNSFIDSYARELQPIDIAVYHALERYANGHTRSTWVGTAKLAEVLNVSQRTVQRSLKVLEELKLIRIVQTSTVKMYFVLPVPPRSKIAPAPLFDGLDEEELSDDIAVAIATPVSQSSTSASPVLSVVSRNATNASRNRDAHDRAYKEEQDDLNKTQEQDLFNKTDEPKNSATRNTARRILEILRLPEASMNAAIAAVQSRTRATHLSLDGIVQDITTAANQMRRRGVEADQFLDDFLAQTSGEQIIEKLHLPATNSLVSTVKAAVKAEASYTRRSIVEVAELISDAALDDRQRGITIDRFYFENVKWRSNAGTSKAEQRKLNNLEVNARVKQRLREKLGAS